MNFSITISFLVGGILMVSLITLNNQMLQNSANATLDMQAKTRVSTITGVLSNDIMKIGYGVPDGNSIETVFVTVASNQITFRGDIFNEDNTVLVTWEFTNNEYTQSNNPDDYQLVRTGPMEPGGSPTTSVFPAVHFNIDYLDTDGDVIINPTAFKDQISRIEIELICESTDSPANTAGAPSYPQSFWERTFIPNGLQFRAR